MTREDLKEMEFLKEMNLISLERRVEEAKEDLVMTKLMKEVFFQ
tara:strand:+ start:867 stop:998 length:132 start_codon:yes stop_codon:yes gene_type:complete